MNGFLARWSEGEPEALAQGSGGNALNPLPIGQVANDSDAARPDPETLALETGTRSISWAEWKANELNKLFEEHRVTQRRGPLQADTVRCGQSRKEPNQEAQLNSPEALQPSRATGDSVAAEVIRETTNLLATAYRRYSAIRRVGADPRTDSGDGGLANSGVRSVHGGDL